MNFWIAAFSGLMLASMPVQATTIRVLSLSDQARRADVIVHAAVADIQSETRNNLPWKVYTLKVLETLGGNSKDLPTSASLPSFAILGSDTLLLEQAPTPIKGQEYIFFLYKTPYDSPIVGFNQGIYNVQDGRVSQTVTGLDPLEVTEVKAFKQKIVDARNSK